jgi:hypothetical protein
MGESELREDFMRQYPGWVPDRDEGHDFRFASYTASQAAAALGLPQPGLFVTLEDVVRDIHRQFVQRDTDLQRLREAARDVVEASDEWVTQRVEDPRGLSEAEGATVAALRDLHRDLDGVGQ